MGDEKPKTLWETISERRLKEAEFIRNPPQGMLVCPRCHGHTFYSIQEADVVRIYCSTCGLNLGGWKPKCGIEPSGEELGE